MSDIERNVRESLRSYGDSVEVDVARFDDVVGRARRRSRRMTVVVASAALVAMVTAIGLVDMTDGNTRSIVPAIDDTSIAELNETADGKFRRITVKASKRAELRIRARPGYYAPKE